MADRLDAKRTAVAVALLLFIEYVPVLCAQGVQESPPEGLPAAQAAAAGQVPNTGGFGQVREIIMQYSPGWSGGGNVSRRIVYMKGNTVTKEILYFKKTPSGIAKNVSTITKIYSQSGSVEEYDVRFDSASEIAEDVIEPQPDKTMKVTSIPSPSVTEATGIKERITTYRGSEKITSVLHFTATYQNKYDVVQETHSFRTDGSLASVAIRFNPKVESEFRYSKMVLVYDRGQEIQKATYFGSDGKPVYEQDSVQSGGQ